MIKKLVPTTEQRDAATGTEMARSPKWPHVEKLHLKLEPVCAACGSTKQLQVHHKKPFHLFPELELDLNNLITLCMDDKNCHLKIGHGDNFKDYNPDVVEDAAKVKTNQALFESVAADAQKKRLVA
jgi:5-methylcytosine-specific restriction endonuclease McrA